MLKQKVADALNEQVNAEIFSAYLYLSMSSYSQSINLDGAANWFRVQAQEEMAHAMKIFDFIIERGGRAILTQIAEPKEEWDSPLAAFEAAYEHEEMVTSLINGLVDLAIAESDHATNAFLQWFVAEQVEEEASADAIVQRLRLAGGDGAGLFMIDTELASRVFTPPAASA